jgi:ELWxxDGT repeat protein
MTMSRRLWLPVLGTALAVTMAAPTAIAQTPRRVTDFGGDAEVLHVGALNGRYLFLRNGPFVQGELIPSELWSTDGTPTGTLVIKPLPPWVGRPLAAQDTVLGDRLFVKLSDTRTGTSIDVYYDEYLYVTDGFAPSTKSVDGGIQAHGCPTNGFAPRTAVGPFASYQDRLYYWYYGLIRSTDGESVTSEMPFTNYCDDPRLTRAGSFLFSFKDPDAGFVGAQGPLVWSTDGTTAGTRLVLGGAGPGGRGNIEPANLQDFGGRSIFTAREDASPGREHRLWSSDGGPAIRMAAFDGRHIRAALASGPVVYFVVDGTDLWSTDGVSEALIATFPNLALSYAWKGYAFFITTPAGGPPQFWIAAAPRSGPLPSPASATLLGDLPPAGNEFAEWDNGMGLYYACSTPTNGAELCRTDGTPAGTLMVADINPGPASSHPRGLRRPHMYRHFFTADDGSHGRELYALGDARILVAGDTSVSEPVSGTATATFTVRVDPVPVSDSVTVDFATEDGTAVAGQDYDPTSGTLTFGPGVASRVVDVTVRRDNRDGPTSRFHLRLSNATGATIGRGQGTAAIEDIDPTPTLTPVDGAVTEGTGAGGTVTLTIALSAPSDYTVSAAWATMDADARAGLDYTAKSGSVTFPPGTTQMTVAVSVIGDALDEPNEAFLVVLSNPVNAVLPRPMGQASIVDDDGRTATCMPIATVPFTITAQGRYCLTRNVSTAITTGAAISIESDYVEVDLRGFKIGGGSAGLATQTDGVRAVGRRNVTVRNGNIRGFYRGVAITGGASAAAVEDLRLDENTWHGIWVEGTSSTVRRNTVVATGGRSEFPGGGIGIRAFGTGMRTLNNDVTDTMPGPVYFGGVGIMSGGPGAVIEGNRVGLAIHAPGSDGIYVEGGDDNLVVRNRIVRTEYGVFFTRGTTGRYRDNLTSGVTTPYSGYGTDAGNNN